MWRTIFYVFFVSVIGDLVSTKDVCPIFQHQFLYRTQTPINVITSTAKEVKGRLPVLLGISLFNVIWLNNTGNEIESISNGIVDHTYVTGGVLCNEVYKFHKISFLINQDDGRSSDEIDGKGSPFGITLIFYKEKYKTFENALKYRDGLTILETRIKISNVPNILYTPIQKILEMGLLREPGSAVPLLHLFVFSWFNDAKLIRKFYVYPGSYTDSKTGREYDSVIYMSTATEIASISQKQFHAFKKVLGFKGEPIQTASTLHPQGIRPVYALNTRILEVPLFL